MSDSFAIELRQQADYRFEIGFDNPNVPHLITDEPAPLGQDAGPNPSRLLLASVANCLSASLLFAMRKFKNDPGPLRTTATASVARNEQHRLRIASMTVEIRLGVAKDAVTMLDRILAQFEEFCVVTQSVRSAIPVDVRVLDKDGLVLKD